MLAVNMSDYGPPGVLGIVESPAPEIGEGDVLVRVHAAGVSRADVLQRQGKYPPPAGASPILGLDLAGVVEAVGSKVERWKPGDKVCALVSGGAYAEFAAVPHQQVLPLPENWSMLEAATLPENLFTVYDNMVTRAQLKPREIVLVHGGTSGIGSMAIMLARALEAIPYATVGSPEKCEAVKSIGAEAAINYHSANFVSDLKNLTGQHGADVVVDILGGSYLERNVDVLAIEGRLALVATLGGSAGQLPIAKLMSKRGAIVASTLRPRTPDQKGQIAQRLLERVWPLLPSKKYIRPLIDSTFPLEDAAAAHERMESRHHVGKIVLTA